MKYISRGNLPQKADYYALLNRSDADWQDTVRQGMCAESDGITGRLVYPNAVLNSIVPNNSSVSNLEITIGFAKDLVAAVGNRYLVSDSGIYWGVRLNDTRADELDFVARTYDNTGTVNRKVRFSRAIVAGDTVQLVFVGSGTQGSPTSTVAGYLNGVLDVNPASIAVDKIYNFATNKVVNIFSGSTNSFAFCGVSVSVAGVVKFDVQFDGSYNGLVSGNIPTSTTGISFIRSDYSSFNSDEHPFAIGTTLIGNASGCLNYGALNLITASTTKMRWQFKLNTVAGAGTTRYICSEYHTTGNKRGWEFQLKDTTNRVLVLLGNNGGTTAAVNATIGTAVPASGDIIDIKFESGIFTMTVNGANPQTLDVSATQTVIYNNNSPDLNVGGSRSSATSSFNGSQCCFKIWVDNILDTDTPKFDCDYRGTVIDKILGISPTVVGTMVYIPQMHPRLLDDSGYAGTITGPYEEFPVKPYPNTFTGNWHELTHAYFDKSNTDIWEDFVRESIDYISEEPNYWHVSEISQDYFDKYVKPAYRNKIYCGLGAEDDDYRGAIMVFESGIPASLLSELTFWRKRKGFPVDRRVAWVDIDTPITLTAGVESPITGRGYVAGQSVILESRLSAQVPEEDWTEEGQATVDGDGIWSIDVTIAVASTRDFRVIDENVDPAICFAQVDDVAVASAEFSGTYEFCAQKINSGDVDKAVYVVSTEVHGDYIYINGFTTGAKLLGSLTNLATVGGSTIGFLAKFNKKMELQWVSFLPNVSGGITKIYPSPQTWVYYGETYSYVIICTQASRRLSVAKIDMSNGTLSSTINLTTAGKIVYDLLGKPTIHDSKVKIITAGHDGTAGILSLAELPLDLSSYAQYNCGGPVSSGSGIFTSTYCYACGASGATGYEILLADRSTTTRTHGVSLQLHYGVVLDGKAYSPSPADLYYFAKWTIGSNTCNSKNLHPDRCRAVRYADSKILVCYEDDGNNNVLIKQSDTSQNLSDYLSITPNSGGAYALDVCDYGDNLLIAGAVKAGGKMNASFTDECPSVAHAFIHIQAKED